MDRETIIILVSLIAIYEMIRYFIVKIFKAIFCHKKTEKEYKVPDTKQFREKKWTKTGYYYDEQKGKWIDPDYKG